MSDNMENISLKLGDVIQIIVSKGSPQSNSYSDEHFYYINYIDDETLKLINYNSIKNHHEIKIKDGELDIDDLEKIVLIYRNENQGYIKQHDIKKGYWIDVHFCGNLPYIITGQITDIEEDMMELKLYENDELIYIDFGYRGLPHTICKIIVRDDPHDKEKSIDDNIDEEEITSDMNENDVGILDDMITTAIKNVIKEGDEIEYIEDDEPSQFTYYVEINENEKRYSIVQQTSDLLDEYLSMVPNNERTKSNLNYIHTKINRFKELREMYSEFDKYGAANKPELFGSSYKPLTHILNNFNERINWILPVTNNIKKIYDTDVPEQDDFINKRSYAERIELTDMVNSIITNNVPADDENNKYEAILKIQEQYFVPYIIHNKNTIKNITTDMHIVVNNINDFKSSVYGSEEFVKYKSFFIQPYITNATKLYPYNLSSLSKKSFYKRMPIGKPEEISVDSFIMMPSDVFYYMSLYSPQSNVLLKANLNKNNLNYWQFLSNKIIKNKTEMDSDVFKSLTHYYKNNEEDFDNYVNQIIPSNEKIFNFIKDTLYNKVSYTKIIEQLELFKINQHNISYSFYNVIIKFMDSNILEFNKKYTRDKLELSKNMNKNKETEVDITQYITNKKLIDFLKEHYGIINSNITNIELTKRMMDVDMCSLYNLFITKLNDSLLVQSNTLNTLQVENEKLKNKINKKFVDDGCKKNKAVKHYIDFNEMMDDNNSHVKLDKQHITDKKQFVEEGDIAYLDSFEYKNYFKWVHDRWVIKDNQIFISKLYKTHDDMLADNTPKEDIKDGDYAICLNVLYKRINDKWEHSNESNIQHMNDNEMLCYSNDDCGYTDEDCSNLDKIKLNVQQKEMNMMIKELDEDIFIEDNNRLKQYVDSLFSYNVLIINTKRKSLNYKNNKTNRLLLKLQSLYEQDEYISSPYIKLRDAILGQSNFIDKQINIIKFAELYTREYFTDENEYWLYCKETNTKLLPKYLLDLANAFTINAETYIEKLDEICSLQGELSDDKDSFIDKHSGFVIKKIEMDTDEGYDEQGFKINTKSVIENIQPIVEKLEPHDVKMVRNMIMAISSLLNVDMTSDIEIMIKYCIELHADHMISETEYNKKRKLLQAKLKTKTAVKTYKEEYDTSLTFITISILIIFMQTQVPSIKTKYNFPNCIRSFEGYPLNNKSDGLVQYMSCVIERMDKKTSLWKSIRTYKQSKLEGKINSIMEKVILKNVAISNKLEKKRYYLKTKSESETIETLEKPFAFLPPLHHSKISQPTDLGDMFKPQLKKSITSGNINQHVYYNVVQGKLIALSLYVHYLISKIMLGDNKVPLLVTKSGIPFLENNCCNDNKYPYKYFLSKIKNGDAIYKQIRQYTKIISEYTSASKARIMLSKYNTKIKTKDPNTEITEATIYKTFIIYCKFASDDDLKEEMNIICNGKPEDFDKYDSLDVQIKKLKDENKNYTIDNFNSLMKYINKQNIINVDIDMHDYDINYSLLKLQNTDIDKLIYDNMSNNKSDTYDKFVNYLASETNNMYDDITKHLELNSKLINKSLKKRITTVINLLDESNLNFKIMEQFIKNISYTLVIVIPNIINNKKYNDFKTLVYWNFSEHHGNDIQTFVNNQYKYILGYFSNDYIHSVFELNQKHKHHWLMLLLNTNFDETKHISKFLLKYYFYKILCLHLSDHDTDKLFKLNIKKNKLDEDDSDDNTDYDTDDEQNNGNINATAVSYIRDTLHIFYDEFNKINYTRDKLMRLMLKEKEVEKTAITDKFKYLSDEERIVKDLLKNNKLDGWDVGENIHKYDKDRYDMEIENEPNYDAINEEYACESAEQEMRDDMYLANENNDDFEDNE